MAGEKTKETTHEEIVELPLRVSRLPRRQRPTPPESPDSKRGSDIPSSMPPESGC
ncbi:MAG: hypothetical protein KC731_20730 [Myxococcales bacterium]|nr:hypothetical protein [Myxococcales bacterium]